MWHAPLKNDAEVRNRNEWIIRDPLSLVFRHLFIYQLLALTTKVISLTVGDSARC